MATIIEPIQSTGIYQINANDISDETRTPSIHTMMCNWRLQLSDNTKSTQEMPIQKSKLKSSPPSSSSLVWISGESDEDNLSTKIEDQRNNFLTYHQPSLPITYSGCYRKKSHSVKLTRHDEHGSCPRKAVRFADDFGLELSRIKIINTDELPFIPNEAFKDLHINHEPMKTIAYMELQFKNPMYTQGFNDRVSRQKIVLEQANAIDNRIYGTIRLVSLGLHKQVKIRLTTDNWISFQDYDATYINNSYDGICDRFSFILEIDRDRICIGNNIQFCICYQSLDGSKYWDNNFQQNYRLNCLSRAVPDYSTNANF